MFDENLYIYNQDGQFNYYLLNYRYMAIDQMICEQFIIKKNQMFVFLFLIVEETLLLLLLLLKSII